jgi:hypothetical protein
MVRRMDSASLPPESVAQCTTAMASRHKSVATIMFWLDGLFAAGVIAMIADRKKPDWASLAGGMAFWVGLFSILAIRALLKARKVTALGKRATEDSSLRWYLNGKMVVGASATGAPLPDLSFKITQRLITVLTAVPRAHVVNR